MEYFSGEILTEKRFKKGYIGIEKKEKIVEFGKGLPPKKPLYKGIILPTFVNAHTHIGDSFISKKKISLPRNVEELVAPPYGLKHRLLKKASEKEIINGMKDSINLMTKTGINYFCDFRENGINGINQLKKAIKKKKINSYIFSRPAELKFNKSEMDLLLDNSIGIGLSSISDWDFSEIEKVAKYTKKRKKLFAIHASERTRENIDFILDLKPDFLVHMILNRLKTKAPLLLFVPDQICFMV
jgi:cytosine/adenosine deaminase-related metal-dependent hydrolase